MVPAKNAILNSIRICFNKGPTTCISIIIKNHYNQGKDLLVTDALSPNQIFVLDCHAHGVRVVNFVIMFGESTGAVMAQSWHVEGAPEGP